MKKSARLLSLVLILAVVVSMGGCAFFGGKISIHNRATIDFAEGKLIIGNGYGFYQDKDENLEPVLYENEEGDEKLMNFYCDRFVMAGDTVYSQAPGQLSELWMYSEFDDGVMEHETIIDEDTFLEEQTKINWFDNWTLIDDKIYFSCVVQLDMKEYHRERDYKIGYMSIEDEEIELFDDICASDMVIDGDWIYYYDCDYEVDSDGTTNVDSDSFEGEICRMKLDGSDSESLMDGFEFDSEDNDYYYGTGVGEMQVVGNYLYFIDGSDEGESRVCRLNLKNGDSDYVTENGAYSYAISEDGKTLYYSEGRYNMIENGTRDVYETDLKSGDEDKLFETSTKHVFANGYLVVEDGCLYFISINVSYPTENASVPALIRYDLETEETEVLDLSVENEYEITTAVGPGGTVMENKELISTEYFVEWIEYED